MTILNSLNVPNEATRSFCDVESRFIADFDDLFVFIYLKK